MKTRMRPSLKYAVPFVAIGALALTWVGCSRNSDPADSGAIKLKVAYIGLTCEAPIFVAYENGFYKEEGLDVKLVKTTWNGLRQGLGNGNFDSIQTLIMYILKPMEQGLDAKITGGVHTGCLRLQVGASSKIKSIEELKGKKIGIPAHLDSPPHLFASRVLAAHGIDPSLKKKDVTWITYPEDVLGKAIEDGLVDAIATSDPVGTILVGMGLTRTIADQAEDPPYSDEYCCVAVVSGKLARENPAAAAKVTRALLKASKWVDANPTAAAKLAIEKKYTATSVEINAQALAKLHYVPGVAKCRLSIGSAAVEMQKAGLLETTTSPQQLTTSAWLELDGVTDEWLNGLKVERVQGGGPPVRLSPFRFALLWEGRKLAGGCCSVE